METHTKDRKRKKQDKRNKIKVEDPPAGEDADGAYHPEWNEFTN